MTKREIAQRPGLEYHRSIIGYRDIMNGSASSKQEFHRGKKADQAKMQSQETLWQSKRIPSSG